MEAQNTKVLEKLELVDNEVDVRELSAKDYKQLMFRLEVKKVGLLEQVATTLLENNIALRMLAKEKGIEIDKIIDDAFGGARQ